MGSQGGREWEAGARRGSANGEAKAALELVLPVIQEGPEGQRQRQGRQLLLQRGAHDPVAVHGACGQTAALRAMCQLPTQSRGVVLQATSDTTSQSAGFQTCDHAVPRNLFLHPKYFSPRSNQLVSPQLSEPSPPGSPLPPQGLPYPSPVHTRSLLSGDVSVLPSVIPEDRLSQCPWHKAGHSGCSVSAE